MHAQSGNKQKTSICKIMETCQWCSKPCIYQGRNNNKLVNDGNWLRLGYKNSFKCQTISVDIWKKIRKRESHAL